MYDTFLVHAESWQVQVANKIAKHLSSETCACTPAEPDPCAQSSLFVELEQFVVFNADAVASAPDAQLSGHEPVCPPAALCCRQGSTPHSYGACRCASPCLMHAVGQP